MHLNSTAVWLVAAVGLTCPVAVVAKRTPHTIRGSLVWGFGYDNVSALPIAAIGLPALTNSLRLRGFRVAGRDDNQPQG